jgi:exonuclease SbcD
LSERDTTILFVGDMHLGRLPSRVPAGGHVPPLAELGPGAAWRRVAEEAVRLAVDAVALAGDVVHGGNDLFEGANELAAGLETLKRAGIPVFAVAGNHDTRILPDLARRGGITLLGPGGTWSAADITPPARTPVRLVGWSFPEPHWTISPLATPPPAPESGVVTLGLLHADLDLVDSLYAPVSSAALTATGYAGWLLGHIHRPDEPADGGRPFYLGSVCGLDPTETGRHGPVLVRVSGDGRVVLRRLALAPLAWAISELDLSPAEDAARDLSALVRGAMEDAVVALGDDLGEARAVGVRLVLRGTVADPAGVRRTAASLTAADTWLNARGAVCFLEGIIDEVRSGLDLAALAVHPDPAGLLARRILTLEGAVAVPGVEDPATWCNALLREARRRLGDIDAMAAFGHLVPADGDETVRHETLVAARAVLEHLLATKGGDHAADPA